MNYETLSTPWGTFAYVTAGDSLLATLLPDRREVIERALAECWPGAIPERNLLPEFCRQVAAYFRGESVRFVVAVDYGDITPFRQAVLEACRRIPYGATASYADLARAAGSPGAARAVGGAMASNRFPLVVPCHRVLCAGGGLGGFSSSRGVSQKKRLLALEGVPIAQERDRVLENPRMHEVLQRCAS